MLASLPDWLVYGLPALLYLLLTAWAIAEVLGSPARRPQKVLWVALLLLFPLLGLFNWMIMGSRRLSYRGVLGLGVPAAMRAHIAHRPSPVMAGLRRRHYGGPAGSGARLLAGSAV